ncbi:hypothetical protein ACFPH6_34865 [Streptomyces xiangluensis]|uniref:Uncharacterized protein n=1 Tax=Streptomyces xiangluensis TaxID=2665720 RepID=A0ABV8YWP5_9ACTN
MRCVQPVSKAPDGRYEVLIHSVDGRPVRTNSDSSITVGHGTPASSSSATAAASTAISAFVNG